MIAQALPNPFAPIYALADTLGDAGLVAVLLLALFSIPHPAFILAVNGRRNGHFRTIPILWGLAGGLAVLIALAQLKAGLFLTPLLYLTWAMIYGPAGVIDAVSRAMLLIAGRRGTLRSRQVVRWTIDALTVWPAWIIGTLSLVEGTWLGWPGVLAGVAGAAGCLALTAGRPLRRYVAVDISRVGGVNTGLWTAAAVCSALGFAVAILALPAWASSLYNRGFELSGSMGVTLGAVVWTTAWTVVERRLAKRITVARREA